MGLRERKSGAVGRVLKGRVRRRRIEIRRRRGIKRKWQSRLVLWPESPTPRVRLTRLRLPVCPFAEADPFARLPFARLTRLPRLPPIRASCAGSKMEPVRAYCGGPLESVGCRRESVSPYWFAPAHALNSRCKTRAFARPRQAGERQWGLRIPSLVPWFQRPSF